jgi:hypothetical protein
MLLKLLISCSIQMHREMTIGNEQLRILKKNGCGGSFDFISLREIFAVQ